MKLYAQHGASQGEKTVRGIEKRYIDGVIYSPRDISFTRLQEQIKEIKRKYNQADQFFDPQYYAAYNVSNSDARLGYLVSSKEYATYFRQRRRRDLEQDSEMLKQDIADCLNFQKQLKMSGFMSPNILISNSLDSIEAVVAKNFIRQAGRIKAELNLSGPLYATLALSREALMDKRELFAFLEDITVLEVPPDGFYVLVSSRSEDARTDILNTDVIAGWLLINYSLSINGYKIINGYSDILTPFLGIAGASAGATGWWSNLRTFSLNRFLPAGGGRLPIQRYLSKTLLNRITFYELDQIIRLRTRDPAIPNILNGMETDAMYPSDQGYEPDRAIEVTQTWETLKNLCDDICQNNMLNALQIGQRAINNAIAAYDVIRSRNIPLDSKSNGDHLEAIQEGLRLFVRLAEIEISDSGMDSV
jgi:hypothetical protein